MILTPILNPFDFILSMNVLSQTFCDPLKEKNRFSGRRRLAKHLGTKLSVWFATLATIPIPLEIDEPIPEIHPLQMRLSEKWRIEIPIIPNPQIGCYMVRLSTFLYNHLGEYQRLGEALQTEIPLF